MVEVDRSQDDSPVQSLERLIRDERDRFAMEQRLAADELRELAERLSIVTTRNEELEAANKRLRQTVAELKPYRERIQRITGSPLYRPVTVVRKLAGRLRGQLGTKKD